MKLSTGKVAFPIEFDNGDKAVIYFNPNDRELPKRLENIENSVEERIKNIDIEKHKARFEDGVKINLDFQTPDDILNLSDEELASLKGKFESANEIDREYNHALKEELDKAFESKISDIAFRYCEPFDSVIVTDENGNEKSELYIMHFVHWLLVELKKYSSKNSEAMNKHIAKYNKK